MYSLKVTGFLIYINLCILVALFYLDAGRLQFLEKISLKRKRNFQQGNDGIAEACCMLGGKKETKSNENKFPNFINKWHFQEEV